MAPRSGGLHVRSLAIGAAYLVDRVLGFVLIAVITRRWAPGAVGWWLQAVTVSGAIATIASAGLYQAQIRVGAEARDAREERSLELRVILATSALLFGAVLATVLVPSWASLVTFGESHARSLLAATALLALSELWAEFVATRLRALVDAKRAALFQGSRAVVRLIAVLVFVAFPDERVWPAVALAAAAQLLATIAVFAVRLEGGAVVTAGTNAGATLFTRAVRLAWPMVPAAFIVQTFLTLERFVVTAQHGATDLSQFAVGVGLAGNAMLTYTIIGNMLYPMMVQARRGRDGAREQRLVEQGLAAFLFIAIPVLCVIPVVSLQLVPLLTSASYALQPVAFAGLLVGAAGFGVHQLAGYVFYLEERTHELLWVLGGALVVKGAMAFVLIPRLGVDGAVWSYAVGGAVLALATVVRARQLLRFAIPWALIGAALAQGAALAAVTWLGTTRFTSGERIGPVLIALGALGAFGLLQRNRVLQMLRGDA